MFRELNRKLKPYNARIMWAEDIMIDKILHTYNVIVVYNDSRYCITGTMGIVDGIVYSTEVYVSIRDENLFAICNEVIQYFAEDRK